MWNCVTTLAGVASLVLSPVIPHSVALPKAYQLLSAEAKQEVLWNQHVLPSRYKKLPSYLSFDPKQIIGSAVGFADLRTVFTRDSDVMPFGRRKMIHSFGSVAPVEFIGDPTSRFTGLFRENKVPGLARISLAAPPLVAGNIPGMGLKLFVDGKPSANIIVMNSVNGQGANTNPFAKSFSNIIPSPEGVLLTLGALRFMGAVKDPTELSLKQVAQFEKSGAEVASPVTPYQVVFVPTKIAAISVAEHSKKDFRQDLAMIQAGTPLYDVYAKASPGSPLEKVGSLKTTGPFVASEFGDAHLFFQHESPTLRAFGF